MDERKAIEHAKMTFFYIRNLSHLAWTDPVNLEAVCSRIENYAITEYDLLEAWLARAASPQLEAAESPSPEPTSDFDDWWEADGRFYDPDFSEVPWYDKRKGLAEYAWHRRVHKIGAGAEFTPSFLRTEKTPAREMVGSNPTDSSVQNNPAPRESPSPERCTPGFFSPKCSKHRVPTPQTEPNK